MFFLWIRIDFVFQCPQRGNHSRTRFRWFNHRIQVSAFRRDKRIRKSISKLFHFSFRNFARSSPDAALNSRLYTMSTAPSGPITAISAEGHAKLASVRICFEAITQYAPPYALRVITVIFGTVASANAIQQFRSVLDDPAKFLLRPRQKSRHIFQT